MKIDAEQEKLIGQFLSTIYEPEDPIWVTDNIRQKLEAQPLDKIFDFLGQNFDNGVLIGVNPAVAQGVPRCADGVGQYRSFLIEFDKNKETQEPISIKKQLKIMEASEIPHSSAVFSGGKSVHFTIVLDEPLETALQYKTAFHILCAWLEDMNDTQCSDTSRMTRCPGTFRAGEEQRALYVTGRVSKKKFLEFLHDPEVQKKYQESEWAREKKRSSGPSMDRAAFRNLLRWYVENLLGKKMTNNMFVRCPVCFYEEGHDKHGDNWHLWTRQDGDIANHCHYESDHGLKAVKVIMELKKKYGK